MDVAIKLVVEDRKRTLKRLAHTRATCQSERDLNSREVPAKVPPLQAADVRLRARSVEWREAAIVNLVAAQERSRAGNERRAAVLRRRAANLLSLAEAAEARP